MERRILLNRFGDFSSPGNYVVHVSRHVSRLDEKHNGPSGAEVTGTFTFSVKAASSPDSLKDIFAPYIADLNSTSLERRQVAATVITSLPARFLEPYLIRLLEDPYPSYAIQGLRRLNTENSRAALFHSIEAASSSDWNVELAEALATMGDANYAPRLVALIKPAFSGNQKTALLTAAARLDPKQTGPAIQRYLTAADGESREIGVNALAATEQPEAIPVLVRLLNDSFLGVRGAAAKALMSLTRISPDSSPSYWPGKDPKSAAPFWNQWLAKNPGLPIHLLRQCPQEAPQ